MAHAEGSGKAEDLGADVADADEAEGAAFETEPEVADAVLPAAGAEVALFDGETVAEGEEQGQDGLGHGAADAVGGDGDDDAGAGAGFDVDGVVADAETGKDGEAVGGLEGAGGEASGAGDDGVEAGDVVGIDFGNVGHEFEIGGDVAEDVEAEVPGWEVALVVEEIGGEPDAERLGVHRGDPLRLIGEQVRSVAVAVAVALWRVGRGGVGVPWRGRLDRLRRRRPDRGAGTELAGAHGCTGGSGCGGDVHGRGAL